MSGGLIVQKSKNPQLVQLKWLKINVRILTKSSFLQELHCHFNQYERLRFRCRDIRGDHSRKCAICCWGQSFLLSLSMWRWICVLFSMHYVLVNSLSVGGFAGRNVYFHLSKLFVEYSIEFEVRTLSAVGICCHCIGRVAELSCYFK